MCHCASTPVSMDGLLSSRETLDWMEIDGLSLTYLGAFSSPQDLGIFPGAGEKFMALIWGSRVHPMGTPAAVCTWDDRVLAVVDRYWNGVHFYDIETGKYHFGQGAKACRLISPVDAVFDTDGILYVTDSEANTIIKFDPLGRCLGFLPVQPVLQQPTGICFNEISGELYVAETGAHRIARLSLRGERIAVFGERGIEPGQFNYPVHLAMGSDETLYICDAMNFRIQVTRDFKNFRVMGFPGDQPGALAKPKGLAVDGHGRIVVADAYLDIIQFFSPSGETLGMAGRPGNGPGEFCSPSDVWISGNHRLYIADAYNQRIQVFQIGD